ncbi:MAG: alpha/beta hydrolase [Cyclobacteriaceae bacterium]
MTKEQLVRRNNIKISGDGEKTMVFAHGFGCDQNMWRYLVPAFSDSYKIVLFDHVGSGNSDLSAYDFDKYDTLQGYADDIIEICQELALSNVTFVGHSVSAMIGVLASLSNNDVFENIVMVGPSASYINCDDYIGGFSREDIDELLGSMESNYLGWSSAMAPAIMANDERPELSEELANSFCRNDPKIAAHFAKVTFLSDHRHDLKNLKTKTLIIQCSEDVIAPTIVGEFIAENIESSELVIAEATGHCPHLSAPKETIEIIKHYLNSAEVLHEFA